MKNELEKTITTIEVYLGGRWLPWNVEITQELNRKLMEGKSILIADEDSNEIFIRRIPPSDNLKI